MSNTREVGEMKAQLQSSEALVADLQQTLHQRDSELETLRSKVSQYSCPNCNKETLTLYIIL